MSASPTQAVVQPPREQQQPPAPSQHHGWPQAHRSHQRDSRGRRRRRHRHRRRSGLRKRQARAILQEQKKCLLGLKQPSSESRTSSSSCSSASRPSTSASPSDSPTLTRPTPCYLSTPPTTPPTTADSHTFDFCCCDWRCCPHAHAHAQLPESTAHRGSTSSRSSQCEPSRQVASPASCAAFPLGVPVTPEHHHHQVNLYPSTSTSMSESAEATEATQATPHTVCTAQTAQRGMEGSEHQGEKAHASPTRSSSDPSTHDKDWQHASRRAMASPGTGRRKGPGNRRSHHGKRKHRKRKPYAEMTWEERRDLVNREAKQATAANEAALSTLQKSTTKGTVALPLAPRLTGGNIMDEREERVGIARTPALRPARRRSNNHSSSDTAASDQAAREADRGTDSKAPVRMDSGADDAVEPHGDADEEIGLAHSPALSSEEEAEEFEEAFEECMHEDYNAMSRQQLIARLQEKDQQLSTLEQRLTSLEQKYQQQKKQQQRLMMRHDAHHAL